MFADRCVRGYFGELMRNDMIHEHVLGILGVLCLFSIILKGFPSEIHTLAFR